ncbi:GDSL esterase/lipase [Actinidia chinensis var. chinensis]|uniref:GDSL esterase/lipase n=1 Tax=Actinidia chinensis var. chinensis TaxID=1590841 RepID=A0A2R6RAL8_ACTCC|nr:GDSL esterase/lipase [Actinidia chinensis var. chinensis]
MRVVMTMVLVVLVLLVAAMPIFSQAMDIHQMRQIAAKNNVTCILVFGDSSVDPGNNNRIPLAPKSNFPPYGKDLFHGHPTGRFTNGRLATDFIAEAFGYTNVIRGFLDSNMEKVDLLHGVSFASSGSGYDELTTNLSNSLSVSKQLEYLRHYKIHLRELVGEVKAEEIIRNAIFVISMGTNDFLQNYFTETTRRKQFTVDQYQNYLISSMFRAVKAMHYLGARRLAIVGVPPFGCMPIVETLDDESQCDDEYNQVAFSFNSKIKQTLATLKATLGIQNAYIDIYSVIASAIKNPKIYGFKETSKGCCGTGLVEYGDTCRGMSTCANPTEYVFWDAVHPTEKMYEIVAVEALKSISENMLN